MYARVIIVQVQYDKLDEASRLYREALVPAAQQLAGFSGSLWLVDSCTGKNLILLFWETEAALKAGETNDAFQHQFLQMANSFVSTPIRESYEVGIGSLLLSGV